MAGRLSHGWPSDGRPNAGRSWGGVTPVWLWAERSSGYVMPVYAKRRYTRWSKEAPDKV